jgi:hypothetical protein
MTRQSSNKLHRIRVKNAPTPIYAIFYGAVIVSDVSTFRLGL